MFSAILVTCPEKGFIRVGGFTQYKQNGNEVNSM